MITWRNILESLQAVDNDRLDDPASLITGEPLELLEIWVPEIGDNRIVAVTNFPEENDG